VVPFIQPNYGIEGSAFREADVGFDQEDFTHCGCKALVFNIASRGHSTDFVHGLAVQHQELPHR
jgi:hypothetical protein